MVYTLGGQASPGHGREGTRRRLVFLLGFLLFSGEALFLLTGGTVFGTGKRTAPSQGPARAPRVPTAGESHHDLALLLFTFSPFQTPGWVSAPLRARPSYTSQKVPGRNVMLVLESPSDEKTLSASSVRPRCSGEAHLRPGSAGYSSAEIIESVCPWILESPSKDGCFESIL